jgi:hypothetical protein
MLEALPDRSNAFAQSAWLRLARVYSKRSTRVSSRFSGSGGGMRSRALAASDVVENRRAVVENRRARCSV